jgi:hypothetical protein
MPIPIGYASDGNSAHCVGRFVVWRHQAAAPLFDHLWDLDKVDHQGGKLFARRLVISFDYDLRNGHADSCPNKGPRYDFCNFYERLCV